MHVLTVLTGAWNQHLQFHPEKRNSPHRVVGQSGTSPLELWLYSRGNPLTSLQYTALPGGEGPSSGGETGGGCSGEQDTALATRRKFARFPRGHNDGLLEPCCFTARSYVRLKLAVLSM